MRGLPAAIRREAHIRASTRALELRLGRAARRGRPVVVGPWLSEVGFEVLYWIPMVRSLLERHRIPPERVVVVTRGGAGVWYRDFAERTVEVHDLVDLDEWHDMRRGREEAHGGQKQWRVHAAERRLLERAGLRVDDHAWLHPLVMYNRLRYFFAGEEDVRALDRRCRFRPLARSPVPGGVPATGAVAIKLYFSDCLPETEANRQWGCALVDRLAAARDVVLLNSGLALDDHWEPAVLEHSRVHTFAGAMTPSNNLALQTSALQECAALVSTYGGFSYLGPFLSVATVCCFSDASFAPAHLRAMHHAQADLAPGASLTTVDRDGRSPREAAAAVADLVESTLR